MDLNDMIDKSMKKSPLYPYQSAKLFTLFYYGSDYERQRNHSFLTRISTMFNLWMFLFLILMAILLCILRRMAKLRRDGLYSTIIDISITFTGGGNIRIDHKMERWLFGIAFVGFFFLIAIWQNEYLYPSLLLPDETIDSFEELAGINPPIYLSPQLKAYNDVIVEMLRLKLN